MEKKVEELGAQFYRVIQERIFLIICRHLQVRKRVISGLE